MEPFFLKSVYQEVIGWKEKGYYPYMPVVKEYINNSILIEDYKPALMFGSCDYLGLAKDDYIIEESIKATREFGTNTYGAQLFCGYTTYHKKLVSTLAEFFNRSEDEILLLPSSTHANVGVISTLMGPKDVVINDRLNHSSILIGGQLSKAEKKTYSHSNMEKLEQILIESTGKEKKLIVTDALFSADGDFAKINDICDLADKYNALVMVDEAHSFGVCGKFGRGFSEAAGVLDRIDIYVGTMSKALASVGGFVIAKKSIIEILRHLCSLYTSSRGSTPGVVAASVAALNVVRDNGQELREKLAQNTHYMLSSIKSKGFNVENTESHIIPIITKDSDKTAKVTKWIMQNGLFADAMITPSVPHGKSRLRIGVTAKHTLKECEEAINILQEAKELFKF